MTSTPTLIDTEHYAWRVPWVEDGVVTHYIIPRSDSLYYETPAAILFDTRNDAIEWFRDERLEAIEEHDEAEVKYLDTWVLVKITVEVTA